MEYLSRKIYVYYVYTALLIEELGVVFVSKKHRILLLSDIVQESQQPQRAETMESSYGFSGSDGVGERKEESWEVPGYSDIVT